VDYLSDGTSRPYYSLYEKSADGPGTGLFITNHNQGPFAHARRATLAGHEGVTFPVRIPAGATGAALIINYMRQNLPFEETVDDIKQAYGKPRPPREAYQNVELIQPFK
jgi:hypothetical protein